MKTLVVGGTGMTGAAAALYLRDTGHDVSIVSRHKPSAPCLSDFPFMAGDYIEDTIAEESLVGFDWLVFAAGADIRQLPQGEDPAVFFQRANVEAIPRFFATARAAGIRRAVYIGSYYPQVVPEKIDTDPYVRSRHLADAGVRALCNDSFCVCSLNAPFILGRVPGIEVRYLKALVQYAAERLDGVPIVAPAGGVNHITTTSMAEAVHGALQHGQCGKAYLVGDENLSWKAYLEMYFDSAGNPQDLDITTGEHPLFPDAMLYAGRNAVISYEPENGELGYSRNRVRQTIDDIVRAWL